MIKQSTSRCSRARALLLAVLFTVSPQLLFADTFQTGQHIEPAYEGWRPNADGSFSFMFGYMNENWSEEPDAPVGENNFFSPGDADRGQPTHFLPRRNRFNFEVTVPAEWTRPEKCLILTSVDTLRSRGEAVEPVMSS